MRNLAVLRRLGLATLLATAPLAHTGCFDDSDEFREAIPSNGQITVPVPGAQGKTSATESVDGVGVLDSPLLGARPELYELTWAVSSDINTRALVLLGILRTAIVFYPTSRTVDSRTWGPYTPGGLDPLTYRATVTRMATGVYHYSFEARARTSTADSDFLVLIDGTVTKGPVGTGTGKGDMTLHFDNQRKLRSDACEVGTITGLFDDTTPTATLDVTFTQFANSNATNFLCRKDKPVDSTYHYARSSDGAGNFVFTTQANVNWADSSKSALEDVSIRSRWRADGAGRSDAKVSGGDVTVALTAAHLPDTFVAASQCWGSAFTTTYETSTPDAARIVTTAGDPAACPYTTADLP